MEFISFHFISVYIIYVAVNTRWVIM